MYSLTTLLLFLSLMTSAYALKLQGLDVKKIDHHLPDFQASFSLKNEMATPNIIVNINPSKNKCYALYDKSPINPGKETKITVKCQNLISSYYYNSFLVSYIAGSQGTKTIKLAITGSSFRQDCGDVDLDRDGGTMKNVKVRNQEQTPFCMYNSIAQINDALRFSQGIKNYSNTTSAEELALSYWKKQEYEAVPTGLGNTADNVFDYMMNRGSCFSNQLSSNINPTILGVLSDIFKEGNYNSYNESLYLPNKHFESLNKWMSKLSINPQNPLTLYILKKYVSKQDYTGFVEYLLGSSTCMTKNSLPVTYYKLVSDIIYPSKHVRNKLTSDKSMPILAMLSTDFFKNEYSSGIWFWQTNHAVLITGRRLNEKTGRCQVKIRNSWGKKSSYKNSSLEVDKENGSFWVNESTLAKHLGQTYSVY